LVELWTMAAAGVGRGDEEIGVKQGLGHKKTVSSKGWDAWAPINRAGP
jgi:hypothetical protein